MFIANSSLATRKLCSNGNPPVLVLNGAVRSNATTMFSFSTHRLYFSITKKNPDCHGLLQNHIWVANGYRRDFDKTEILIPAQILAIAKGYSAIGPEK
jgi:hypothetical protein